MANKFPIKRIMLLEFSQYLENFLWKYFNEDATDAHVLSICLLINEKCRERVPPWEVRFYYLILFCVLCQCIMSMYYIICIYVLNILFRKPLVLHSYKKFTSESLGISL